MATTLIRCWHHPLCQIAAKCSLIIAAGIAASEIGSSYLAQFNAF